MRCTSAPRRNWACWQVDFPRLGSSSKWDWEIFESISFSSVSAAHWHSKGGEIHRPTSLCPLPFLPKNPTTKETHISLHVRGRMQLRRTVPNLYNFWKQGRTRLRAVTRWTDGWPLLHPGFRAVLIPQGGFQIWRPHRRGRGGGINAPNLGIDSAEREERRGLKIPNFCGRHIWKPQKAKMRQAGWGFCETRLAVTWTWTLRCLGWVSATRISTRLIIRYTRRRRLEFYPCQHSHRKSEQSCWRTDRRLLYVSSPLLFPRTKQEGLPLSLSLSLSLFFHSLCCLFIALYGFVVHTAPWQSAHLPTCRRLPHSRNTMAWHNYRILSE